MEKQKRSEAEELTNSKKNGIDTENAVSLKKESSILKFHMLVNISLRVSILLD